MSVVREGAFPYGLLISIDPVFDTATPLGHTSPDGETAAHGHMFKVFFNRRRYTMINARDRKRLRESVIFKLK